MPDEPYCPKCGARMVLKTNTTTDKQFYSCNTYPDCNGTVNIDNKGRPEQGNDWSFLKKRSS